MRIEYRHLAILLYIIGSIINVYCYIGSENYIDMFVTKKVTNFNGHGSFVILNILSIVILLIAFFVNNWNRPITKPKL